MTMRRALSGCHNQLGIFTSRINFFFFERKEEIAMPEGQDDGGAAAFNIFIFNLNYEHI